MSGLSTLLQGQQAALFLAMLLALALAYALRTFREKEELKHMLQNALKLRDQASVEPPAKQESARNQVYLREKQSADNPRPLSGNPIYKIVITGGPCGGKSSSLARIQKDLSEKGFRVFSVPQVPTLVVHAGGMILMAKFNIQERIKFQRMLIRFQMYAEDYFTRLAEMSKSPCIILCDRGTADPQAYVSKEEFQAIMDEEGWTWTTLRDKRYDRVIHLVSAADGAESFYSLENNVARSEGVQLARTLDKKTLDAWTGHPHITVCPNVTGETFDQKLGHAVHAVYKTVGLEVKQNRNEKFIIKKPAFPQSLKVQHSDVEQIFLLTGDKQWSEEKIKRRGQNQSFTYQHKYRCQQNSEGDYLQEIRVPITALQYVELRDEKADKKFKTTHREVIQFIVGSTHFKVDVWKNLYGEDTTYVLRFDNPNEAAVKKLVPEFIEVVEDVRQNAKYSLKAIASAQ